MIPDLVDIGGPWAVLPPEVHDASLQEIEERFASNSLRRALFAGFERGLHNLGLAGCRSVYLDGSFTTKKPDPNDFDACWDPTGVDYLKLDGVLLDFSNKRRRQKLKYLGEFFPANATADGTFAFVDYFQIDKYTGNAKGIVRVQPV